MLAGNYKMLKFARPVGFKCCRLPEEHDVVHIGLQL